MKKNEFLQDAMGLIDDELVAETAAAGVQKRRAAWWICAAAAACIALLLWGVGLLPGLENSEPETVPVVQQADNVFPVAENLWKKENFQAFSLSYHSADVQMLNGGVVLLSNTVSQDAPVQSQPISVTQAPTVKFERLIAQRYAVYRSEAGTVVFYDTVEDRQVDLQERILGDTSHLLEALKQTAAEVAEERYPGFLASPVNQQILDLYLTYLVNDTLSERWDEITALTPDTGFMDSMEEYQWMDEEERYSVCWNLGWNVYFHCLDRVDGDVLNAEYLVRALALDERNGICIIRINDMGGSGHRYLVYDIRTDTCTDLPRNSQNSLIGVMQNKGYTFRFSADGTIATVAYPSAGFAGVSWIEVQNYRGEDLGVFFLEGDKAHSFQGWTGDSVAPGASELFISDGNSVLYYKKMDEDLVGRSFPVSEAVWANRLKLYSKDTDQWAFHTVSENYQVGPEVTLQGNFLRFAADETIVIMEQAGSYHAYSLADGSDVTQAVLDAKVAIYAHEQLTVTLEEGQLYAVNIFTGEKTPLGAADTYILSDNGAFVFAYRSGDDCVTCYNVASGESCQIQIDSQLRQQLFATEDAVLQMSYNEEENTLLLSYYVRRSERGVDFYDLLEQIPAGSEYYTPTDPVVRTDLSVTENVMAAFRESAYRFDHPDGVLYWYSYYPEFMTQFEDRSTIFGCLGLTEPEDYLNAQGTRFVLYEDEDEKLVLNFWQGWLLYDYQDWYSGFDIQYTVGGKVYHYEFLQEAAR